jgi:hypothetical protein
MSGRGRKNVVMFFLLLLAGESLIDPLNQKKQRAGSFD